MPVIVIIIVVGLGVLALVLLREQQQTSKMITRGLAVKRDIHFYKYIATFITNTRDFAAVCSALDQAVFNEMQISSQPNAADGWIKFLNAGKMGTYQAVLQVDGNRGDRYAYSFQFLSWTGPSGEMNKHDVLSGNVLLTAVEKAFITLDPNAGFERERMKIK